MNEREVVKKMKRNFSSKNWLSRGICLVVFAVTMGVLPYACDSGAFDSTNIIEANTALPVKDEKPLVPDPSWDCGMPGGIPSPEFGELVFVADMTIGNIRDMGQTQYGRRHVIEVTGGRINGPNITADVLNGGLDYQLTLSNGAMEIEQLNILKTSDGSHIYFRTCGASSNSSDVRMVPFFEADSSGAYSFLNHGKYAGTRELDAAGKTLKLKIYDVSNVVVDSSVPGAIKVAQPNNVPDQSWECRETDTSQKGDSLLTETVTLAPTITVGDTENGERKIAPITGGSILSGSKIAGEVLYGGADYQLFGNTSTDVYVDARYIIETDDGELINVRNCGPLMPLMTLAPSFETRRDGKYSYLNTSRWQSGFPVPNLTQTQVTINIFEYPQGSTDGSFDGTYSIIAHHSGKALDVFNWGTTDGSNIVQWTSWDGDCQKFIITPVEGVWHRIIPVIATDQSFDVAGRAPDPGANIQTWTYWGGTCQQFRFQRTENGYWQIIPRNSGLCLDVLNASLEDGANVMQYTCISGAEHQMFELIPQ